MRRAIVSVNVRYAAAGSHPPPPVTSGTTRTPSACSGPRTNAAARNHSRLPGWIADSPRAPSDRREGSSTTTGVSRKTRWSASRISGSELRTTTCRPSQEAVATTCDPFASRVNSANKWFPFRPGSAVAGRVRAAERDAEERRDEQVGGHDGGRVAELVREREAPLLGEPSGGERVPLQVHGMREAVDALGHAPAKGHDGLRPSLR